MSHRSLQSPPIGMQIALFVEDGVGVIDPTKADGFLNGLRVGAAWSAGGGAPGAQPHTSA